MRKPALIVMVLWVLSLASPALADNIQPLDLSFSRITSNSSVGDQINLNLNISQLSDNTLVFELSNLSGIESVVSEIYFQDLDGLVARYQILNEQSLGNVLFDEGANPGNLPGGRDISFSTAFALQANNPSPKYGINPQETLKLYVELNSGVAVATLLESLGTEGFRIGAHVQSIAGGASDSFVSGAGGQGTVPEPATLVLAGSGLLAGWVARRRRKRARA